MEKTFREVIATIKEGEVWDNAKEGRKLTTISVNPMFNTIVFEGDMSCVANNVLCAVDPESKFKLRRKEYTFQEAFVAYEEGKEIESISYRYKKNGTSDGFIDEDEHWLESVYMSFDLSEIRGNWYINN